MMKYLTIVFILFVSQNIFAESTIYHCKVNDAFKINNNVENVVCDIQELNNKNINNESVCITRHSHTTIV